MWHTGQLLQTTTNYAILKENAPGSCLERAASRSNSGCYWCRRVSSWGVPEKDYHWCRGAVWAVGSHETCHPGTNWKSLIMWGCPVANRPVFSAVWSSCDTESKSCWEKFGHPRKKSKSKSSWVILILTISSIVVLAVGYSCKFANYVSLLKHIRFLLDLA